MDTHRVCRRLFGQLALCEDSAEERSKRECSGYRWCTALGIAAQRGHKSITGALIRAGSNLDAEHSSGDRPLHLAARMGHVEAITVLVEAGASVDSHGARGETALWIVALQG